MCGEMLENGSDEKRGDGEGRLLGVRVPTPLSLSHFAIHLSASAGTSSSLLPSLRLSDRAPLYHASCPAWSPTASPTGVRVVLIFALPDAIISLNIPHMN